MFMIELLLPLCYIIICNTNRYVSCFHMGKYFKQL